MSASCNSSEISGAQLVARSLAGIGAERVFGLPGVHGLGIWDAFRAEGLPCTALRTELDAAFAAQAFAQWRRVPSVLLVSTGPGALIALGGVMEAASSHVPVVILASEVPRAMQGAGRGFLHELRDQLASYAPIVKWARSARSVSGIPGLLAEAWDVALTPPAGPVYVGLPYDLLNEGHHGPVADAVAPGRVARAPSNSALNAAAALLAASGRPVIWAGGGVLRSDASAELTAFAELLDAPVLFTYMGKGAIPERHPLAVGSDCESPIYQAALAEADVVLAVGTELGAETTRDYSLRFSGRLIHVDAAPERIGATYPALGLVGDAARTLAALSSKLEPGQGRQGRSRAQQLRENIAREQGHDDELGLRLTRAVERALPSRFASCWDSTILSYWAAAHFSVRRPGSFLYPLGSGTIGYALPAAIGVSVAAPDMPVLCVVGDGGFAYGIGDLAVVREQSLNVKVLLVDDGGYGILRHYQERTGVAGFLVDLARPSFPSLVESFRLTCRVAAPDTLTETLGEAFAEPGPSVTLLPARLAPPPSMR